MAALVALFFAGCEGESGGPTIARIDVTSNIDSILPVGASAQLSADAVAENGAAIATSFDWSSANPAVASVSGTGRVQALGPGVTTITATPAADGVTGVGGTVEGRLGMQVLDADVPAIHAILTDPLLDRFTSSLTASARSPVAAALGGSENGLATGNLVLVIDGLETVRTLAFDATDGTDRALLATVVLLTDFAETLLNF